MSVLDLWAAAQADMSALGRGLPADEADAPVPACPVWTVRDVFAHQAADGWRA